MEKKSGFLTALPPSSEDRSYLAALHLWGEKGKDALHFIDSIEYLGILIGANVSLDDIFNPTINRALERLGRFYATLQRLPL